MGRFKHNTSQASAVAAFVIPSINGVQYNIAQWGSVVYPASKSTVFFGSDRYNNVAYSFSVTADPSTGYLQFSTSDGMLLTRANFGATTYMASKGANPNRDVNIITAMKFDISDAEVGGGGSNCPCGPIAAAKSHSHLGARFHANSQQVDALVKGLVVVGAVLVIAGGILALPALAVGGGVAAIGLGLAGGLVGLLAGVVDYENTLAGESGGNGGGGPWVGPPPSSGPPSIADFCVPYSYQGIAGIKCTFYY